jgi:hypothetical protein
VPVSSKAVRGPWAAVKEGSAWQLLPKLVP